MPTIKSLFDENLTFERRVEKVITFSNREEHILRNEARDYVLTDNLSHEYERLLGYFDDAQSGDGAPDCCTWLSGFYGSGKSSFAKYFGLTFDPDCMVEDDHFRELFTARFESQALQQRIRALTKKYNMAVFLLDLAAQGVSNASNTPISTLLFDQVCAWAGYPSERKVAELLALLELDDKLEEFKKKAEDATGLDYPTLISQPILLISAASGLAHEYYPKIWLTPESFLNAQSISSLNDQERVRQILDLIEKKTGTRRVLFIVDEVGHFLRNNANLINNLDGLAKNLKEVGEGKAWLIATAQQTIPKAGPLFGLQDRFPIKIDLRASDIREITHKRLLKKKASGAERLHDEFKKNGQRLLHSTQLTGCDGYPKLDESSFVEFYPLLPQQFELLIRAISSLAKSHGGVGLRSAIRCIEEILINQGRGGGRFIDGDVGKLITTSDLYQILEKDIVSVAREITLQVDAIQAHYGENSVEHHVAQTVAVLQQIDGFPSTRANIAALLHQQIDGQHRIDEINNAVDALIQNPQVMMGESDGLVTFLSEVVSQIEKERATIPVTITHRTATQSASLKELFGRPVKTTLAGTKTIDAGIALFDGNREQELTGSDKEIRFLIRLVEESNLNDTKTQLTQESLGSQNKSKIYFCATLPKDLKEKLEEIYRSEEIARRHRNHTDQEVIRYLEGQTQMAGRLRIEIQQAIQSKLQAGWFIFQGQSIAVDTLGNDLDAAMKTKLGQVSQTVFSQYDKAAVNVRSTVAEAFLKTNDLTQITKERDPLGVVAIKGSATEVNTQHPALLALMDFFQSHPNPDGKRVLDEFSRAPYGWMKDTTRYLLAALFSAQKIKLKVQGVELTVVGEQSIAAFQNNSSFNQVTLNQNLKQIPPEIRQAAAKRLSELTGETVTPLPQRIADVAGKHLPKFQSEIQSLPLQVSNLGVDTDRLSRLQRSLNEALMGDGAEATPLFGAAESEIYDDLIWARKLKASLKNGAEDILKELATLKQEIHQVSQQQSMPSLIQDWEAEWDDLDKEIKEARFIDDLPGLAQKLDALNTLCSKHCETYAKEQKQVVITQIEEILSSPTFTQLDESTQDKLRADAEKSAPYIESSLQGIQSAPHQVVQALGRVQQIRKQVKDASTPQPPPTTPVTPPPPPPTPAGSTEVQAPNVINSEAELDGFIQDLNQARPDLAAGKSLHLRLNA